MQHLITQKHLSLWLGYKNKTQIEKCLVENRIPFLYGRGGEICTTSDCIANSLLGDESEVKTSDSIEFL